MRPPAHRFISAGSCLVLAAALCGPAPARADEGQWTPDQIANLDFERLRRRGLELSPEDLWTPEGGLLRAAVNLSGCSAAFISPDGLIATNHHCAYGALQAASSVEHDYLRDGFLARTREDELEARGRTVKVLRTITDVSSALHEAVASAQDPAARARAVDALRKRLVQECEAQDHAPKCQAATFYNGSTLRLFEYLELRDVRLVYAPPAAIGEYGGETDNWMWPRHTGDFSLLRAYTGPNGNPAEHAETNVPYHPTQFLRVSTEGVGPGDFVGVMGYPGRTNRYLPAAEVARYVGQVFPTRIRIYGAWIAIMERLAEGDHATAIKVAAKVKSLANRHKNARGMVAGIERMKLVERRQREEQEMRTWVQGTDEPDRGQALDHLTALSKLREETFPREFLRGHATTASDLLAIAWTLVRRARERIKPDLERQRGYMERDEARLRRRVERHLRDFSPEVDEALLQDWMERASKLGGEEPLVPPGTPGVRRLVRGSSLARPEVVWDLYEHATAETLARHRDPMIRLAHALVLQAEAQERADETRTGQALRWGPVYFEILREFRRGPVYPDANGTLRLSVASVRGYDPRDGLRALPQTTLGGAVAKHTGQPPFDLPAAVRDAATQASETYWADPILRDVPLCFLSDADTTGGNSGSPVIDGKGRLVGLNFDRVWENIAGDFGYNEARSRNITVDVRYLLWMLDRVEDAGELLAEMGADRHRSAGRRPNQRPREATTPQNLTALAPEPGARTPEPSGCGCRAPGRGRPALLAGLLVLLALTRRDRRRRTT